MGVGSGGPWPSWIFIHDTNIANRDLKVLFEFFFCYFSVFFPLPPPPWKKLNSASFSPFSVAPPRRNFSADALDFY